MNGKTSEEIRRAYPLQIQAMGVINGRAMVVQANYDQMKVIDERGNVLFSYESNGPLLMQFEFAQPNYLIVVSGYYICPNQFTVLNLKTFRFEYDRVPISEDDMMQPITSITPDQKCFVLESPKGNEIYDVATGIKVGFFKDVTMLNVNSEGEAAYFRRGSGIFLNESMAASSKAIKLRGEYRYNSFACDISAIGWLNRSRAVLISPLGHEISLINLDSGEEKQYSKPRDEIQYITVCPDDKYAVIKLLEDVSYLLNLSTGEEIDIEECHLIDINSWYGGYIYVASLSSIRKVDLSTIIK